MSSNTRRLDAEIVGRTTNFEYSEHWIGYAILTLRLVMGWTLFQGGITKLVTYLDANPENNWTAAGYLANAIPQGNPARELFISMAGNPIVDILNMWGLTLTGLALLLGAFVRWSAFWGAVMMLFYWLASLQGGSSRGCRSPTGGSSTTTLSTPPCCSGSVRSAPAGSSASTST